MLREATGGRGVDVILDMVGGDYVTRNLALLAIDGRLVQIAFLQVVGKAEIDLMQVMRRRLTITGSTLRPRTSGREGRHRRARWRRGCGRCSPSGAVRPVIHATFPLEQAADAHRMMEAGEHIGKIVLEVMGGSARCRVRLHQLGIDVRTGHRLFPRRRARRLGLRLGHDRVRLRGR